MFIRFLLILFVSTFLTLIPVVNISQDKKIIVHSIKSKKRIVKHISRSKNQYLRFKATAYTAGPESTGKTPDSPLYGITASGKIAKEKHTIAVDPNVIPLGSEVYIKEFNRIYVAEDTGGSIKGNRIDIFMNDLSRARKFGIQEVNVIVRKSGKN